MANFSLFSFNLESSLGPHPGELFLITVVSIVVIAGIKILYRAIKAKQMELRIREDDYENGYFENMDIQEIYDAWEEYCNSDSD